MNNSDVVRLESYGRYIIYPAFLPVGTFPSIPSEWAPPECEAVNHVDPLSPGQANVWPRLADQNAHLPWHSDSSRRGHVTQANPWALLWHWYKWCRREVLSLLGDCEHVAFGFLANECVLSWRVPPPCPNLCPPRSSELIGNRVFAGIIDSKSWDEIPGDLGWALNLVASILRGEGAETWRRRHWNDTPMCQGTPRIAGSL